MKEALEMTQASFDEIMAKDNCEECTTMILLAFLAAYENYQNRQNSVDEEFALRMIETTLEYAQQTCG